METGTYAGVSDTETHTRHTLDAKLKSESFSSSSWVSEGGESPFHDTVTKRWAHVCLPKRLLTWTSHFLPLMFSC